jgi:hypothetical protein
MAKKNNSATFKQKEAQKAGNLLLENTLDEIRNTYPEIYITLKPEEDQDDKGIDFQLELVDKTNSKTFDILKLQNKGTYKTLKPLTTTENKGFISFQLEVKHARYYRQEIPVALLFTVCDINNKKVYWHAMQRDDSIDKRAQEAESKGQESIQIYIDPSKILSAASFREFLDDAERSYREQNYRFLNLKNNPIGDSNEDYEIDKNKPILDQLFDYMELVYDEVKYMPVHLLIRNYPFQKTAAFRPYYHRFQVVTDNEELVDLLDSIKKNYNGNLEFIEKRFIADVDNYEEKAAGILAKLTQNHIFSINSNKNNKTADVRYFRIQQCDCVACQFSRLDFVNASKELQKEPAELKDGLKYAYVHYQTGDFLKAAHLFEKLAAQAKKESKDIVYLITQFNLVKLGRFIRNNYWEFSDQQYGKKLELISLDQALAQIANKKQHRSLLSWIREQKFIYEPFFHINDEAGKLRNDYQGHIKGNRGTNHNTDELISAYLELHMFVDSNYLVYDKFSEYSLLTDAYTEGLFASYAMRHDQGNTLQYFNEFHIRRLIFDGSAKSIQRYFNKYHLKTLLDDDKGRKSFLAMVKNLLLNNHLIKGLFQAESPERDIFYKNKYQSIFTNTLCLTGLLELKNEEVELVSNWLIKCLKAEDLHSPDCYAQVNNFIARKSGQLSLKSLYAFTNLTIDKPDLHTENRIEYLTQELYKREANVPMSKVRQKAFLKLAFGTERDRNFNVAVDFHRVAPDELKTSIISAITKKLDDKFDSYQYYFAAIFSLLPANSRYFMQFVTAALPDPDRFTLRRVFYGEDDNRYPLLDMLLNLCFKNKIKLTDVSTLNFKGFGDYYDWLLDMNNFNYDKFQLRWLGLYGTKYYFAEFRKHKIIREKLESYLAEVRDLYMERMYIDLYNPAIIKRNSSEVNL